MIKLIWLGLGVLFSVLGMFGPDETRQHNVTRSMVCLGVSVVLP